MVVLFESYGNFTSGQTSYLALTSKKSRGTITLTEKEFLFNSEKDNILFHLRTNDIQNFSIRNRFKLLTIELVSVQGINYTFYPHKKEKHSHYAKFFGEENLPFSNIHFSGTKHFLDQEIKRIKKAIK